MFLLGDIIQYPLSKLRYTDEMRVVHFEDGLAIFRGATPSNHTMVRTMVYTRIENCLGVNMRYGTLRVVESAIQHSKPFEARDIYTLPSGIELVRETDGGPHYWYKDDERISRRVVVDLLSRERLHLS